MHRAFLLKKRQVERESLRATLKAFADEMVCSGEGEKVHRPAIILLQVCDRLKPLTGTQMEKEEEQLVHSLLPRLQLVYFGFRSKLKIRETQLGGRRTARACSQPNMFS